MRPLRNNLRTPYRAPPKGRLLRFRPTCRVGVVRKWAGLAVVDPVRVDRAPEAEARARAAVVREESLPAEPPAVEPPPPPSRRPKPVSDRRGDVVASLDSVSRVYKMGGEMVNALIDFTFQFRSGEYWAVMGTSGSGKSTLLNLLGCIDRPSSGSYKIRGQEVSNLDDDELSALRGRELGFIFQSYNLIPQLNVIDNILVPVIYQDDPIPNAKERAIEIAERVGLKGRLDHRPNQLSGGQQQRVAIARSLINDPAMILADEATGNLDSQTAGEILDLFDELNDSGKTILLVTHEPEVGRRAQHILRLKDGRIEAVEHRDADQPEEAHR